MLMLNYKTLLILRLYLMLRQIFITNSNKNEDKANRELKKQLIDIMQASPKSIKINFYDLFKFN